MSIPKREFGRLCDHDEGTVMAQCGLWKSRSRDLEKEGSTPLRSVWASKGASLVARYAKEKVAYGRCTTITAYGAEHSGAPIRQGAHTDGTHGGA